MVTEKLDVIGAWSDESEVLTQVVYEHPVNGTIFIARVTEGAEGTTAINTSGGVSFLSNDDFKEIWLGGCDIA